MKSLYFNTRRSALEFGRELKLATASPNIVAQGFEVRFPPDVFGVASEIYQELAPAIKNHSVNIGVFAAATLSLLGHRSELVSESSPILEAFRRSDSTLSDASAADVAAYLERFDDPAQIAGVINNVKGIYHEQLYVNAENSDGDLWTASLLPETNYPGVDVELVNPATGQTIDLQLKATDSLSYISQHTANYPDIAVVATSETASQSSQITDSGFTNESIQSDVEDFVSSVASEDAFDSAFDLAGDMFTNGLFATAISEGLSAATAIGDGKRPNIDIERIKKAATRAAGLALVTGIVL